MQSEGLINEHKPFADEKNRIFYRAFVVVCTSRRVMDEVNYEINERTVRVAARTAGGKVRARMILQMTVKISSGDTLTLGFTAGPNPIRG